MRVLKVVLLALIPSALIIAAPASRAASGAQGVPGPGIFTVRLEYVLINSSEGEPRRNLQVLLPVPRDSSDWDILELRHSPGNATTLDDGENRYAVHALEALEGGEARVYSWIALVRARTESGVAQSTDEALDCYLEDSPLLSVASPPVARAMRAARGDQEGESAQAECIRAWVSNQLASERSGLLRDVPGVLASGRGSYLERLRVQLALLRAAGIPSRITSTATAQEGIEYAVDGGCDAVVEVHVAGKGWRACPLLQGGDAPPSPSEGVPAGKAHPLRLRLCCGLGERLSRLEDGDLVAGFRLGTGTLEEQTRAYWCEGPQPSSVRRILQTFSAPSDETGPATSLQQKVREHAGPMGSRARLEWIRFSLGGAPEPARELVSSFGLAVGYLPALRSMALSCVTRPADHPLRKRLALLCGKRLRSDLCTAIDQGHAAVYRWWGKNASSLGYNMYTQRFTVASQASRSR